MTPTVTPGVASVTLGSMQQFTASVAVNWSVIPSNAGTISAAGVYQAPATMPASATVSFSGQTMTAPTTPAVPGVAATCDAPKGPNGVTVPAGGITVAGNSTVDITLACRGAAGSAPASAYLYTTGPSGFDTQPSFHPYLVNLTANVTGQTAQTLAVPMKLTIMPGAWVGPTAAVVTMVQNVTAETEVQVVLAASWPFNGATAQGGELSLRFVDAGAGGPFQTAGSCSMVLRSAAASQLMLNDGTAWDSRYMWLGAAGLVDNSQCSVNLATSGMVASGGNIQYTLGMKFKTGWNNRWVRVYARGYTEAIWPYQFSGWREILLVKIGNP